MLAPSIPTLTIGASTPSVVSLMWPSVGEGPCFAVVPHCSRPPGFVICGHSFEGIPDDTDRPTPAASTTGFSFFFGSTALMRSTVSGAAGAGRSLTSNVTSTAIAASAAAAALKEAGVVLFVRMPGFFDLLGRGNTPTSRSG